MKKRQITRLKKRLPRGAYQRIANKKGVSYALVCSVFSGRRKDCNGIFEEALIIAVDQRNSEELLNSKMESL